MPVVSGQLDLPTPTRGNSPMSPLQLVQRHRLGDLSEFRLPVGTDTSKKEVSAFVYEPVNYDRDAPALVVLPGVTRASGLYLSTWMPFAEAASCLLIVPRFSKRYWPGARSYNLGNMYAKDGAQLAQSDWSFTALDELCDAVYSERRHRILKMALYGHSAGAQFVHRYLLFRGGSRVSNAVVANAGWYTVPSFNCSMPYGIGDAPAVQLHSAFATPMTIVLGKQDIRTQDKELRQTEGARAQGPHRLARGRYFFQTAKRESTRLGLPFKWSLREIGGCGHSDKSVAPASAELLLCASKPDMARAA